MMATTHALVGLAGAALVSLVHPELAPVALPAAFAGGFFPDLDLYAGHRRTLHFPVYYWPLVLLAGVLVALGGGTAAGATFGFLLGAALHSSMDVLGGGLELRPWQATAERAVYNHALGRWHRPRRWVRYDGAPEDLIAGVAVAVPVALVVDPTMRAVVGVTLGVSLGYAAVRRHVPALTVRAVAIVPRTLHGYVPDRFFDG